MIARARGAAPGTYTGGRIVNVASMAGLRPLSQIGVYAMSKAAVVHMTRAMALEWGRYDINVNALCPGYIDTEINHHHWATEPGQKLIQMTAAQARRQARRPRQRAADAVRQREPLHQRRRARGRRRLRPLRACSSLPEGLKLVHEMRIPVRWGDLDAMGHVNNTVYFRYFEIAAHRVAARRRRAAQPGRRRAR